MRYYLILNPGSRSGKSKKLFNKIFSELRHNQINFDYTVTHNMDEIVWLSRDANESGMDVIVAVGGDGTVNGVINGFYNKDGKRISNAKMGVVYTGTSPDFCKSYDIPYKDVGDALDILIKGKARSIPIGKIEFCDKLNQTPTGKSVREVEHLVTRYFACCANIGFGAVLAEYSNRGIRKYLGDFLGTFISMIRSLINYRPCKYLIKIDGVPHVIDNVHNLSMGKTYYIASGIKVKNELDARSENLELSKKEKDKNEDSLNHEGHEDNEEKQEKEEDELRIKNEELRVKNEEVKINNEEVKLNREQHLTSDFRSQFYLLSICNLRFFRLWYVLRSIYSGKQITNDDIFNLEYITELEVQGSELNPGVEFDGDPHGYLPCRITPAEDNLEIITR